MNKHPENPMIIETIQIAQDEFARYKALALCGNDPIDRIHRKNRPFPQGIGFNPPLRWMDTIRDQINRRI